MDNLDIVTAPWQQRPVAAWAVYTLLCPVTGSVRYVGFTSDVAKRFKRHVKNGRTMERDYPVNRWIHDLHRRGLVPDCEVIERGAGPWEGAEAAWIAHFRTSGCELLNVCAGGFFAVPEDARRRAGEKLKGRDIAPATREKLRAASTGKARPDAVALGAALAARNRGRKRDMTPALLDACKRNGRASTGNLFRFAALSADEQAAHRARQSENMRRVWAKRKEARHG